MKYAKSMTLGGQLIDATKITCADSKNLLPRCPICGKPVFLKGYYVRSLSQEGQLNSLNEWMHYPEVDSSTVEECEAWAKYGHKEILKIRDEAKDKRYEIYNAKLWDILKTSDLINWDLYLLNYERFWKTDVLRWYGEKLLKRFRSDRSSEIFDATLRYSGEQAEKKSPWFAGNSIDAPIEKLIVSNVTNIYSQKIVREAFMYLWFHGSEGDIKKLIVFGINTTLTQEIYAVTGAAIISLNDLAEKVYIDGSEVNVSELDNYQALMCAETMAYQMPAFKESWEEKMSEIEAGFFLTLCVSLLAVPWIDELKKISQQQPVEGASYGGN